MKIRNRLALFSTLFSAGILLALSLISYFASAAHRKQHFYNILREEVRLRGLHLQKELPQEPFTCIGLRKEVALVLPIENKKVAMDSLSATFPQEFVETLFRESYAEFQVNKQEGVGQLIEQTDGEVAIVVAANDMHGKAQLANLRKLLITGFLLSVPLLYLFGRLSARYILKPIAGKVQNARRISTSNLHLRLTVSDEKDELGQLASAFNDMLDRLESSFEMQRNFISNASHEIGNPLSAILGEAEVCLERKREPNEYIDSLQSISKEAERLNTLVSSLLSLAQTGFDETQLSREETRLDEVLLEARLSADESYTRGRIHIDFTSLPENPDWMTIHGNPNLLRIAFTNLMENACKFSSRQEVLVTLAASDEAITIRVIDKGVGIPAQEVKNIFQPFYRARNARSFKGFGIGLSLTDKIIRLHHGQINILSEEGKGTTMEVQFFRTLQKL